VCKFGDLSLWPDDSIVAGVFASEVSIIIVVVVMAIAIAGDAGKTRSCGVVWARGYFETMKIACTRVRNQQ
jgi:hypothetical protein